MDYRCEMDLEGKEKKRQKINNPLKLIKINWQKYLMKLFLSLLVDDSLVSC